MTYLLNISFMALKELEEPLMTWINDVFVPVITDPVKGFDKFEFFKMLSPREKDHITICMQLRASSQQKLEDWFELAIPVCDQLYRKYDKNSNGEGDIVIFPSMMKSID